MSHSHSLAVVSPPAVAVVKPVACKRNSLPVNIVGCRRNLCFGLLGAVVGVSVGVGNANAARRMASAAPQEKKDPSLTALQAKVLASKRRKEAMKETVAKLREKGTPSS